MENQNPVQAQPSIPVQAQPIIPPTPQPVAQPQPITPIAPPNLEQKSKFSKWMVIAIAAALLIVILVAGYSMFKNSASKTQTTNNQTANPNQTENRGAHDRVGNAENK